MQVFEVNGEKYIEKYKRKSKRSGMAMSLIMMAGVMSGDSGMMSALGGGKRTPTGELIVEYGLIMLKKSNLTSNQRRGIVYQFEKDYMKLSDLNMYEHLYGKFVQVDDSVGNVMVWDEKWAWINNNRFIPTEITEEEHDKQEAFLEKEKASKTTTSKKE